MPPTTSMQMTRSSVIGSSLMNSLLPATALLNVGCGACARNRNCFLTRSNEPAHTAKSPAHRSVMTSSNVTSPPAG